MSTPATAAAPPAPTVTDLLIHELERILRETTAQYEQLHALAHLHRDGLRRADTLAVARCVEQQNLAVQRIADMEKRRIAVVTELASRLGSDQKHQTPITWIAQRLPEPAGPRLLAVAQALRDLMDKVLKLNESTRKAAEMLSAHMEGLFRAVAAKLNHAQTYGPRGMVSPGPRVVSALDSLA